MDPWLKGRIRLADRRGLFARGSLNEVQEMALELAILLDEERRQADFATQVKLAFLTADPDRFAEVVFPEQFSKETDADELDEALDSKEGVEIDVATTYDPKDAERLMGQLLKGGAGTFGLGEVSAEDDDDGEDWGFGYEPREGATEDDLLELPEGMTDVDD